MMDDAYRSDNSEALDSLRSSQDYWQNIAVAKKQGKSVSDDDDDIEIVKDPKREEKTRALTEAARKKLE